MMMFANSVLVKENASPFYASSFEAVSELPHVYLRLARRGGNTSKAVSTYMHIMTLMA